MGRHSRRTRSRVRATLTAGLVGLGTIASVGVGHADHGGLVEGTPCTSHTRACVDLAGRQAWLFEGGAVVFGPTPISAGSAGRETPTGDFRVEWKNKDHRSAEFDGAPMPFAVFFAEGGIAFHEGDLGSPSAGCVRLNHEAASRFYDVLQVGDRVQVR
jgi:hypothetical protein